MSRLEAIEEYQKALKLGQKEVRECQAKGRSVNPEVLHQVRTFATTFVSTLWLCLLTPIAHLRSRV